MQGFRGHTQRPFSRTARRDVEENIPINLSSVALMEDSAGNHAARGGEGSRCAQGLTPSWGIISYVKARRGGHTVYQLAYHFVWIPRCRRGVLLEEVAGRPEELIREICVARDWGVRALNVPLDHVHLLVRLGLGMRRRG
jgi:hypothetical protein